MTMSCCRDRAVDKGSRSIRRLRVRRQNLLIVAGGQMLRIHLSVVAWLTQPRSSGDGQSIWWMDVPVDAHSTLPERWKKVAGRGEMGDDWILYRVCRSRFGAESGSPEATSRLGWFF